ncbi:hypothetical protein B5M09_012409 [Aphanomyces astaci]|uniref:Uncharacterized protein n=1 Tax=Aphanomyces astaci TaxID=112090 RepID=A0A3R7YIA9_APHAT|nr:hypothetical protein B5M09_012409 [Aphanomyces astaci]
MQNSQNSQNSQDVHTPTHHYNTRSSPQPTRAGVYTLRADLFVKESVYARDNSGKRLHPQVFEGAQWSNIRASIFDFCSSHMSPKATYVNDPRTWSVSDSPPTLDDFESYISIKLARYHFKPTSNEQAHAYLASHVNSTFTILVFKWGNQVNTAADLQELNEQCVAPPSRDRAGAAAETLHQETVALLKDKWATIYSAYEATWRMWAASILKKPFHQHAISIDLPPPSNMLHLFSSVPNGPQRQMANLEQNATMSLDVVDSCVEELQAVLRYTEDASERVKRSIEFMNGKRRVIQGFMHQMQQAAQHAEVVAAIAAIPNAQDVDHSDT